MRGVRYYQIDGNIYASKGLSDCYPCAVSHTDTVHRIMKHYHVHKYEDFMYATTKRDKQVGVGGDDKVGIFICLSLLESMPVFKCAFFRDEEVGCLGSIKNDKLFFADVGYVMQADRRGITDITETISGTKMVSEEFKNAIGNIVTKNDRKWVDGMMTDVEALSDDHKISMFNASCGYYHPHSYNEIVSISEVFQTLQMFTDIANHLGNNVFPCEHECTQQFNFGLMGGYGGRYSDWYDKPKDKDIKEERRYAIKPDYCPSCGSLELEYDDTSCDDFCWTCGLYMSEIKAMYGVAEFKSNH